MSFVSVHKSLYLSTVSRPCLQIAYGQLLGGELLGGGVLGDDGAMPDNRFPHMSGIAAFLVWLRLWLAWIGGGHSSAHVDQHGGRQTPNRSTRRLALHKVPVIRLLSGFHLLSRKNMTNGQFNERLCALSPMGRVQVYGMPYWRKTVKGKAAPLGTEHEYWRDPLGRIGGRMSKLLCGIWYAHLWPGWRGLPHYAYLAI